AAVKQREFNEMFDFRHYETITGHLALYYQTPFHNIDLHLLYGRYLAKDWGTTIEVSRRFDNGAEVAAFATFTNVPFSKFGEGSFDKGIRITIPFDFYSLFSSRQSTTVELKPLSRDGGAILQEGYRLYPLVRSLSYGEAYRTFDEFLSNQ
ncbi:MAG: YjbH domain-containing protein, partial [Alphaproteobacteria bacterium]